MKVLGSTEARKEKARSFLRRECPEQLLEFEKLKLSKKRDLTTQEKQRLKEIDKELQELPSNDGD